MDTKKALIQIAETLEILETLSKDMEFWRLPGAENVERAYRELETWVRVSLTDEDEDED